MDKKNIVQKTLAAERAGHAATMPRHHDPDFRPENDLLFYYVHINLRPYEDIKMSLARLGTKKIANIPPNIAADPLAVMVNRT